MRRTRKSYGGRKSRKMHKRKLSKRVRHRRRSKVKRGGMGSQRAYSAHANFAAEGVAPNPFKSLPAEMPVSTTQKILGNHSAFDHIIKNN
jgi:hypothetical protein